MVKLNNQAFAQQPPNQQTSFNQTPSQFSEQASQQQPLNNQTPKGLFKIPENLLPLIPWIPVGLEMLTGQKVPPTGVLADILSGIQQNQANLTQILANQQQLWTKLESLENHASQQLTNLSQQLTSTNNNFRLLATETKRSLEFSPPQPELEPEY